MPDAEQQACTPLSLTADGFNQQAILPYGCAVEHIQSAMRDFLQFIGFVNEQLYTQQIPRLETLLMPANFSSIVGEFVANRLPKYSAALVRNHYHNGHPDLIPQGIYPENAILHGQEGIEIKASRYQRGWQGHNPESGWLMVFCFKSNSSSEQPQSTPIAFHFTFVACAYLTAEDWSFSGRSPTSRRTITASVSRSGYREMRENWIYRA